MTLRDLRLIGTTDGSGDATITSERAVKGRLVAVEWIDGDLADGVDAVLSVINTPSGVNRTLLTLTNADNDAWYQPAVPIHDAAGVAVTFDGTNELYTMPVMVGTPRLVIANGGDTKTGGAILYYVD